MEWCRVYRYIILWVITFCEIFSDHLAKHVKTHNNPSSSRNKGQQSSKMSDSQKSKSVNNTTTATFDSILPEVTSTTRTPPLLSSSSSSSPLSTASSAGEHKDLSGLLYYDRQPGKGTFAGRFAMGNSIQSDIKNSMGILAENNNGNSGSRSRVVDTGENIHYSLLSPSSSTLSPASSSSSTCSSTRSSSSPSSKRTIVTPSSSPSSLELTPVKSPSSPQAQAQQTSSFHSNQFPLHPFQPHFPASYYDNNGVVNQSVCNPGNNMSNGSNNAHFTSYPPLHHGSYSSSVAVKACSPVNSGFQGTNVNFQNNFSSHYQLHQQHLHPGMNSLFGM